MPRLAGVDTGTTPEVVIPGAASEGVIPTVA